MERNKGEIQMTFSWGTEDEIRFIEYLLDFDDKGRTSPKERIYRYLQSCENRINWGQINRIIVMRTAAGELAKL